MSEVEGTATSAKRIAQEATSLLLTAENQGDLSDFPDFIGRLCGLAERFERLREDDSALARQAIERWDDVRALVADALGLLDPADAEQLSFDPEGFAVDDDFRHGTYLAFLVSEWEGGQDGPDAGQAADGVEGETAAEEQEGGEEL